MFIITLCFNSLPLISAEWIDLEGGYTPISEEIGKMGGGFSEMFSGVGSSLSTMVAEKPMAFVAVAVTALLGGGLFAARSTISGVAAKKYDQLAAEAGKAALQAEKKIEQNAPTKVVLAMGLLKPVIGGIPNYVAYNKWHMTLATIVTFVGNFIGHPWIGAGIGGATLTSGWFGQGFAEIKHDIAELDKKNEDLHKATRKKLGKIKDKIVALSDQLTTTKTEISEQVSNLNVTLSKNIENVGQNLINLDTKLKDVPQQILQLAGDLKAAQVDLQKIQGSNATIMQQNNAMVKQTEALSKQLTDATTQFAATKKEFDILGQTLTEQVKKLATDTQQQVSVVQTIATEQKEEIQTLKTDMSGKFTKLFEDVSASNKLLQSFEKIQTSQGEQLTVLLTKINANEERDVKTLEAMNAITKAQEKSAVNYTKIVTSLNQIREANSKSMEAMCAHMTSLDQKLAKTDEKVDGIEKKYEELKKLFEAQSNQIVQLCLHNSEMKDQLFGLSKKMDENNRLAAETNTIAKKASLQQSFQTLPPSSQYVTLTHAEDVPDYSGNQGSNVFSPSWNKMQSFPTFKAPVVPFSQGRSRGSLRLALTGSPVNDELES